MASSKISRSFLVNHRMLRDKGRVCVQERGRKCAILFPKPLGCIEGRCDGGMLNEGEWSEVGRDSEVERDREKEKDSQTKYYLNFHDGKFFFFSK